MKINLLLLRDKRQKEKKTTNKEHTVFDALNKVALSLPGPTIELIKSSQHALQKMHTSSVSYKDDRKSL